MAFALIRFGLAIVFLLAGIAKLADRRNARHSAVAFGIPENLASTSATLLPVFELMTGAALLSSHWAWAGTLSATSLLVLFTGAIAYQLLRGRTPECGCFGQIHPTPVGPSTLIRNAAFLGLVAALLQRGPTSAPQESLVNIMRQGSVQATLGLAGIAILSLVTAMGWILLHIFRQQGRLLIRIEALETRINGFSDRARTSRLTIGAAAPSFALRAVDGTTLSLEQLLARNAPLILLFIEAGCKPCSALLPDIARWQEVAHPHLRILVLGNGQTVANWKELEAAGISDILLQRDKEVSRSYHVTATPSAVLIHRDGTIGSRLVVGPEQIKTFLESILPDQARVSAFNGTALSTAATISQQLPRNSLHVRAGALHREAPIPNSE